LWFWHLWFARWFQLKWKYSQWILDLPGNSFFVRRTDVLCDKHSFRTTSWNAIYSGLFPSNKLLKTTLMTILFSIFPIFHHSKWQLWRESGDWDRRNVLSSDGMYRGRNSK
jgi:hypothetical protein